MRPDEAVRLAGVKPEGVTDVVISHAHWDHMGGIDLFLKAAVWIQKEEFLYYTGPAWQPGGDHGGIDPEDVQQLLRLNTEGRLRLVDGHNVEIFSGIRAYTGARRTFASQYLRVDGNPPFVLASDSVYLYRNLAEHKPSATFTKADYPVNVKNQERMIQLAGSPDRVVPGHDALQLKNSPLRDAWPKSSNPWRYPPASRTLATLRVLCFVASPPAAKSAEVGRLSLSADEPQPHLLLLPSGTTSRPVRLLQWRNMKARVYVSMKPTVLDPQGQTICSALQSLGHREIASVRQGKYFEIGLQEGFSRDAALKSLDAIAREVLSNPVIEEYRVDILE